MIINDASSIIQAELGTREQVLWTGVPRKGFAFRKSDIAVIPFSIMWGGFAIFWEASVLRSNVLMMKLWGIPFVITGLYVMVGRFFVDRWQRDRTFYGVTNERVIIVTKNLLGKQVKSLDLRTLHEITVDERSNKSGTITFGLSAPTSSAPIIKQKHRSFRLSSSPSAGGTQNSEQNSPAFEMIVDVKYVYNLIREAQQSLLKSPSLGV